MFARFAEDGLKLNGKIYAIAPFFLLLYFKSCTDPGKQKSAVLTRETHSSYYLTFVRSGRRVLVNLL